MMLSGMGGSEDGMGEAGGWEAEEGDDAWLMS